MQNARIHLRICNVSLKINVYLHRYRSYQSITLSNFYIWKVNKW